MVWVEAEEEAVAACTLRARVSEQPPRSRTSGISATVLKEEEEMEEEAEEAEREAGGGCCSLASAAPVREQATCTCALRVGCELKAVRVCVAMPGYAD